MFLTNALRSIPDFHPQAETMKLIASAMISALLPFSVNAAEYPAAAQIAAAESAFAAHSVATDMREAFLAAFAEDSTLLRSGPVPGREAIKKNPAPPIELNWRPAFVYAAASGEIGYSTGPWRITSKNNPSAPPKFGQFVSVWKRQADGVWKVFIDFGISHPGPSLADAWLILSEATHAGADEAAAKGAEKTFSEISEKSGYLEALKRFSAKDGRVYREGQAPFLGQDAIGKVPSGYAGSGQEIVSSGLSRAGDMAFALVRIAPRKADGSLDKPSAHALRIWKAASDGKFELVLDVLNEMPKQ
jgi:ketosteroid isomerase-like protein